LLVAILPVGFFANAQTGSQQKCADEEVRKLMKQLTPGFDRLEAQSDLVVREYIKEMLRGRIKPGSQSTETTPDSGYVIPVVVHVIHPAGEAYGSGTNISYAQIRSQLEALNAAFNKNYPAYNGQSHPTYAENTRIRFCLAQLTSDTTSWFAGPGGIERGVKRYADNTGAYLHEISLVSANQLLKITHPNGNHFPFTKYLNIWLVKTIGGGDNIMGYAPRPIMMNYPLDGVVMRTDIFGDNTTGGNYALGFGLNQGKILAHEVGHYLNLNHIFQGGCAGANAAGSATDACDLNGDMICDIEPATTQNIFCNASIPNTCTANYTAGTTTLDMINDYMSYADDDCMNTFTPDQAKRMWATLNLERYNLWQPENLSATGVIGGSGCIPPYLNAQIETNNAVFCAGRQITFSNPLYGNTANNFQWQLPGSTVPVANTNSVTVIYNTAGNYKVILRVSDGSNTRTDCKLDSSMLHMSNWYFGNFGAIDFSAGTPVPTKTALINNTIQHEPPFPGVGGTVSLSDSSGNLLFYSNAVSVWNKHHQKISTSPIFGASDISASTGVCYVPYPGQPGKYFIVGASANLFVSPEGVKFAEVDINSNTVQPFKIFQHHSAPVKMSQFLTVVPHCNGIDYWIIAHGYADDRRFYSYLVTAAGIDNLQAPVISQGTHRGYNGSGNQLKANRKGDKLILCTPHGEGNSAAALYDFDSMTGQVKNEKNIPDVPGYNNIQTGAAFSPNGEFVYLMRTSNFATGGLPYWLFQYRLSDLEYNIINAPGFYFAAPFQQGPDNQIYITTQDHFFARLSNPDQWGGASVNGSFINMRKLSDSIRTSVSIPGFIDAKRPLPLNPDFTAVITDCSTYRFSVLCFNGFTATWNFGDGSPAQTGNMVTHNYALPGNYMVTMQLSQGSAMFGSAVKTVNIPLLTADISGPENICTNGINPSQYFSPQLAGVTYSWAAQNGTISGPDNLPFANVIWSSVGSMGVVELMIKRDGCSKRYTKPVTLTKGPAFNFPLKDSVCIFDSSFILNPLPPGGVLTGRGIINNRFYPSVAGIGNHLVTYAYADELTCPGQVEKILKVSSCENPAYVDKCQEELRSVELVPNVISDRLRFRSSYVLKHVVVYNALGQKVAAGQLTNNQLQLPVLGSGIYTALVFCDKNISYKSFRFYIR
jgi:PKD repeat protein